MYTDLVDFIPTKINDNIKLTLNLVSIYKHCLVLCNFIHERFGKYRILFRF